MPYNPPKKCYINNSGIVFNSVLPKYANEDGTLNVNKPLIYSELLKHSEKIVIIEEQQHENGNTYGKFENENGDIMWVLMYGHCTSYLYINLLTAEITEEPATPELDTFVEMQESNEQVPTELIQQT